MSTEEKPLPDFSGGTSTSLPVRPARAGGGLPGRRAAAPAPATESASAFSIIESDEVSRTLDFGMSEEDMLDDSDGEGSSSELHDSLRALHAKPGAVEEDFTDLSVDYASGAREEDSYRDPMLEFELPDLDAADLDSPVSTPVAAPKGLPRKTLSLPDFSKFDEVPEVEEPAKPTRSTPIDEIADPKKKLPLKLLLVIAAVVIAAVVIVIFLTLPGSGSPAVIAPAVDQVAYLLR